MMTSLIVVSGLAGLLTPTIVMSCFYGDIDWTKQLGGPSWDFTRSWASNVTAAGTILSYSVLLSCFPPTASLGLFSRQGYLSLGTISLGLCVLAPLAFNVVSRVLKACRRSYAGPAGFLVSSGITVGGVSLQFLLGACLVWELHVMKILPAEVAITLIVFVSGFFLLLLWYSILTSADVLAKAQVEMEGRVLTAATWSLL